MADQIYKVRDPQGNIREIRGPAGASDEEVIAQAQKLFAAPAAATPAAAPEEVPFGRRVAQFAVDIPAGLVRGAASVGSTLAEAARTRMPGGLGALQTVMELPGVVAGAAPVFQPRETALPRIKERGAATSAAMKELFGADPESLAFRGAQLGGEIAATMGTPAALAAGAKAAGAAPSVVRALEFGGLAPTGAKTALRGAALRLGGGAAGGAASTALISPEDAGMGAAIGAALPVAVAPVKGAVSGVYRGLIEPYVQPSLVAQRALLGSTDDPQALVNALRATRGMETTPGFTPTMTERLLERGAATPTLAAMEARVAASSPKANRQIYAAAQKRVSALQDQLTRVEQQLQTRVNALRPEAQVELRAVRDQLMQGLAQARNEVQTAQTALAKSLPDVSQLEIGGKLAGVAEAELAAAKTRVTSAYTQAMQLAGDTPVIPFESVVARAGIIRAQPITQLKGLAPETAQVLELYGAKEAPKEAVGKGLVTGKMKQPAPPELPPVVNLEQASALGKALNIDYAALKGSTDSAANIARANVNKMRDALNESIANSGLSREAKEAYAAAQQAHVTEVADRFYTGTASKLFRKGASNVALLGDENIARTILQTETGAKDLLTALGNGPAARQTAQQGIEDLFRREVVDASTKTVKPEAAAAFLQKYGRQIDAVGGGLRQRLTQVQQEATKLGEGFEKLASLSSEFGKKSAREVVDYALQHPSNMNQVQTRIGKDAQSALAREVADRAMAPLKAGDADATMKFLTENAATARQALGRAAYDDLLEQARFGQEVGKQLKNVAEFSNKAKVVERVKVDTQGFTPEQLTNLSLVAKDVQRAQRAAALAQVGKKVAAPDVAELATEAAETQAVSARKFPQLLSRAATVARNTWINLEQRINRRAAAELVTLMHVNPDAAIEALEQAMIRAKVEGVPGRALQTAAQAARVSGAQPSEQPKPANALSPRPINALAP